MESISSPKNSIRTGLLHDIGKTSMTKPLTAISPVLDTIVSLSYPLLIKSSLSLSILYSFPFLNAKCAFDIHFLMVKNVKAPLNE